MSERLAERLFRAWSEQSAAEDSLMVKLEAAGLPDGWNDWWFDHFDTSIEFGQCVPDYRLPQSVLAELWAMGFSRCWVNHTDGMQTYYTPSSETRYSDGATRGNAPHKDELAAAAEQARALAEALRGHIQALDDWLVTYASDQAGEGEVRAAYERIDAAGGTLAYIAHLQEVARAALQEDVALHVAADPLA